MNRVAGLIPLPIPTSPSQLIQSRSLPHIDIKTKERPFSAPYAAKARILVHAHLERVDLPPHSLQIGRHSAGAASLSLRPRDAHVLSLSSPQTSMQRCSTVLNW